MSNTADITREQEFDPARYVFSTAAEPTPIKARTVLPARPRELHPSPPRTASASSVNSPCPKAKSREPW